MNFNLDEVLDEFEKQQNSKEDKEKLTQNLFTNFFDQSSSLIITALETAKEQIRKNQKSNFSISDLESFDKELEEELTELNTKTNNPPNLDVLLNTFSATLKSVVPVPKNNENKIKNIKNIIETSISQGYFEVIIKSIAKEAFRREDFEMLSTLKKDNLFKMEWIQN